MAAVQQRFQEILRSEAQCLARLGEVLEAEREGLARRDWDAIEKAVIDKQLLIAEIGQHGQERLRLLADAGCAASEEGMAAYIGQNGELSESLNALWQEVRERLLSCQEENQVNGRVLEATLRHAKEVLSIVLGQRLQPELYTAEGNTRTGVGGRSFAKA